MDFENLDEGRVGRAAKLKLIDVILKGENSSASCVGSKGDRYDCTLNSCTCVDFSIKRTPCKHIIRLAMLCGIINENGLTPSAQHLADVESCRRDLAAAFGYYHLFGTPIISDAAYDALKVRLNSLLSEKMHKKS